MSEKLRLRSVRLDDGLWGKILLAADDEGRSASQLMAALARAYVEGRAEGVQEPAGAPGPSPDPRQASSAAPAPVVQPPRPFGWDEPRLLSDPAGCPHPLSRRYRGPGFPEFCQWCGQAFARLPGGWGTVVPADQFPA